MKLEVTNISGGYGERLVHQDLSLSLQAGETIAVIGRNGTGKTTLARLISGELKLADGAISLDKKQLADRPQWYRARAGITAMPQTQMVFDSLTVAENLALADTGGTGFLPDLLDSFPRMAERMAQTAGSLSGGERKILGFVRTMLAGGSVILLDEPSEGVQAENIERMQGWIQKRCRAGAGCLLLEQNLSLVLALASRVVALDSGGMVFDISGAQITREKLLTALQI